MGLIENNDMEEVLSKIMRLRKQWLSPAKRAEKLKMKGLAQ
jgi:hypothetical protein